MSTKRRPRRPLAPEPTIPELKLDDAIQAYNQAAKTYNRTPSRETSTAYTTAAEALDAAIAAANAHGQVKYYADPNTRQHNSVRLARRMPPQEEESTR